MRANLNSAVCVSAVGAEDEPLQQPTGSTSGLTTALPVLVELLRHGREQLLTHQGRHWDRDPRPVRILDRARPTRLLRVPAPRPQARLPRADALLAEDGLARVSRIPQ